ncbi:MAG: ABC transporter substrate-binding protein [Sulfuricaulis sp.]
MTGCSTAQPKPAPGIAILLSDRSPAFVGVQREIEKRYSHRIEKYYLGGNEVENSAVQKKIQSSDIPRVVSIGLPAARVARGLSGKRVVFCQVFNYEDTDLVTSWMKGVAAMPPVEDLFRTWKQLSPRLKNVGVITGGNLKDLMGEAEVAARKHGLNLVHVQARSDKETLYAFKRLSPKIQGLWLVPDNRVLSRSVINDMMAYSVRQGRQVAVFSDQLLALGGLLSAETSAADIAEQVLERVKNAGRENGVAVSGLTVSTIRINTVMARRLNLKIPKPLRGLAHAP